MIGVCFRYRPICLVAALFSLLAISCASYPLRPSDSPLAEFEFVGGGDAPSITLFRVFEDGLIELQPVRFPGEKALIFRANLDDADRERFALFVQSEVFLSILGDEQGKGPALDGHSRVVGVRVGDLHFQRVRPMLAPQTGEFIDFARDLAWNYFPEQSAVHLAEFAE